MTTRYAALLALLAACSPEIDGPMPYPAGTCGGDSEIMLATVETYFEALGTVEIDRGHDLLMKSHEASLPVVEVRGVTPIIEIADDSEINWTAWDYERHGFFSSEGCIGEFAVITEPNKDINVEHRLYLHGSMDRMATAEDKEPPWAVRAWYVSDACVIGGDARECRPELLGESVGESVY